MTTIEFIYNGNSILIQCDRNDRIKEIINKYILKASIDKNSIIFLYSRQNIEEIMEKDKIDKIKILVYSWII